MLPLCDMDGGYVESLALFAGKTDLKNLTLIFGRTGSRHTAQIAGQR